MTATGSQCAAPRRGRKVVAGSRPAGKVEGGWRGGGQEPAPPSRSTRTRWARTKAGSRCSQSPVTLARTWGFLFLLLHGGGKWGARAAHVDSHCTSSSSSVSSSSASSYLLVSETARKLTMVVAGTGSVTVLFPRCFVRREG
jgi:hypothetical protein